MINFLIFNKETKIQGKAQFIKEEDSFFYEPWNYTDFSIMVGKGYNSLDVNLKSKRVMQVTGLNPYNNWIQKNLVVPEANIGNLIISADNDCLSGTGTQYATDWLTYYDNNTGWICIGNPNYIKDSEAVLFANNSIAVIKNNELYAIWIKPSFI